MNRVSFEDMKFHGKIRSSDKNIVGIVDDRTRVYLHAEDECNCWLVELQSSSMLACG